jgi:hypothetical protein
LEVTQTGGDHTHAGLKSPIGDRVRLGISQKSVFPLTLSHFTEMVKTAAAKFYPDD